MPAPFATVSRSAPVSDFPDAGSRSAPLSASPAPLVRRDDDSAGDDSAGDDSAGDDSAGDSPARECSTVGLTRFARGPNAALVGTLRVIGDELVLEGELDAANAHDLADGCDGLFVDYQTYLDRLSSPPGDSWPHLLSVAVELLAYNDRVVSEIRDEVVEPLRRTARRRSRTTVRRDLLAYHRKLRDGARRFSAAWADLGERAEPLREYLEELERASPWRDAVVPAPQRALAECLVELDQALENRDLRELSRATRRVRFAATRLENCAALDGESRARALRLLDAARAVEAESAGGGLVAADERARRQRGAIARRHAALAALAEVATSPVGIPTRA